jgi:hypothetical protein
MGDTSPRRAWFSCLSTSTSRGPEKLRSRDGGPGCSLSSSERGTAVCLGSSSGPPRGPLRRRLADSRDLL